MIRQFTTPVKRRGYFAFCGELEPDGPKYYAPKWGKHFNFRQDFRNGIHWNGRGSDMIFAMLGGDARSVRLSRLLRADGHEVRAFALERALPDCAADADAAVRGADCVLLPLPCEKDSALFAPLSDARTPIPPLLRAAAPGMRVFAGRAPEPLRAECRRSGLPLTDFLRREDFALRNAELTAEGALAILLQGEGALRGSRVLIGGYGRIGRFLAEKLRCLGAAVSVAARSPEDRALAELTGCRALPFSAAAAPARWDAVVNTVPATVFGAPELAAFGDARLIELASPPYGFDLAAAEALGKHVALCGGLPGKCAPLAAAAALRDTIYSVLED